ncbi:MAG: hypothetical protein ABIF17_03440 [Patescibacteria group bacterium]
MADDKDKNNLAELVDSLPATDENNDKLENEVDGGEVLDSDGKPVKLDEEPQTTKDEKG